MMISPLENGITELIDTNLNKYGDTFEYQQFGIQLISIYYQASTVFLMEPLIIIQSLICGKHFLERKSMQK